MRFRPWRGDQLAECMPAAELAGYATVLSVHDELTETPDSEGTSRPKNSPPSCAATLAGTQACRSPRRDLRLIATGRRIEMPKMYDPTTMLVFDESTELKPHQPKCSRCGSTDVRWRQQAASG